MRYPKFLKKDGCIGLIATSCGSNKNPYRIRTINAIKYLINQGFKIKKGHRIFRMQNAVSGPSDLRGNDFNLMYKNKNIDFIWSTGGGEIMCSMLPYVDFEKIKKLPPKYFMGFSDNTNLTFTLTTICDVATIYGISTPAFGMNELNIDAIDCYKLMMGEKLEFDNYQFYNGEKTHLLKPSSILEKLNYQDEVIYKSMSNKNESFKGRIIGGCIDVLVTLCGTKYDNVTNFNKLYKEDGIIWYFDVCDFNSCGLYRALFQLDQANWFKNVKGFIFGRILNDKAELFGYSFKKAILDVLEKYNVPIIYDVDISHKSPAFPVINGSLATFTYNEGKGNIKYELK